jgi:outer membrane protein assembly factor BamB
MGRFGGSACLWVVGLLVAATVPVIAVVAVPALAVTATDWPGYLYGPAHTSDNRADAAIIPAKVKGLTRKWHFPGRFLASPTVADGDVFIGSDSGWFYELDATTGARLAKVFLGHQRKITCPAHGFVSTASVTVDPSDGQDTLYASAPDGYLYALRPAGLSVKWRSVIARPSKSANNYFQWSSPTVANGKIYVGISSNCDRPLIRGGVAGYDQATGHRFATFHSVPKGVVGGSVWTSVAVDRPGYVYAATGNPRGTRPHLAVSIVKLDPYTLKPVAHFTVPKSQRTRDNDFGGSPTIWGGRVGACNHNGIYYAVNRSTMTLAWARRIGARIGPGVVPAQCAAGAVFDGTYLYIGGPRTTIHGKTYHGSIRRLSRLTGKFLWQTGLPNGVIGTPSMNGGGVLAVGTDGTGARTPNAVYLINSATGKILSILGNGRFHFAQTTFSDGWMYTADGTGVYGWKLSQRSAKRRGDQ